MLLKSGSKLKTPVNGRVLLESARLSTWVPALSGASVLSIVITRSSPGPSWGMSQKTIGTSGAGGPPKLSAVGSYRQTPVPPEIDIAVGGFCSASGRMSATTKSTVPGPSLWTVSV